MYKIKLMNKVAEAGPEHLQAHGCEVSEEVENPDAMLVRSAKLHDYPFTPELLCIARAGAGTNNIPLERCLEEGIAVFNTPGANSEAVKELAICALLMSSRDVVGGAEWVRGLVDAGDAIPGMVEKGKSSFAGPELAGKTLGVVGLGAVGAKIASAALSLGMTVYGYDPYLSVDAAWMLSSQVIHATDIDMLYRASDYITLHVPYMKSTHHLIDATAISKMRDGVRLINLARGELVDDDALVEAIDNAKVANYVTDFPNAALVGVPNVVALPHLGASTPESEEKCSLMAAKEILAYLQHGNVENSVNFPNASLPRTGTARLCIFHRNVPRMLNACLDLVGEENLNVDNLVNKARGDYAYSMIDIDTKVNPALVERLMALEGVIRVRLV